MKNENNIIGKIENGIVIDHIPKGNVWKVAEILKMGLSDVRVSLADNCESHKISEGKGIVKIENFYPSFKELNLIALVAPLATITTLKQGEIVCKQKVKIPELLEGVISCVNSNCISRQTNENIVSKVYFKDGTFSCHYCEIEFDRSDL